MGLTDEQAANRLAAHFSAISKTVEPLDFEQFHPALRLAVEEGKYSSTKPILTQQEVFEMFKKVKKPKSAVLGDVPRKIISEFSYDYAKPATLMFNKIIQSCNWPDQWKMEQAIVLSKCKNKLPHDEEDLRTISKTQWLLKARQEVTACCCA